MIKDLSKITKANGLGEITFAPESEKLLNEQNSVNKETNGKEMNNSEFEDDNMSVASFRSIKSKPKIKRDGNSDSVISNSEFEEDNMSVGSFNSVQIKGKTRSQNIDSDKVVRNSTFDE